MSTCPTCNEDLLNWDGVVFHESTGVALCHVAQEAEAERIAQHQAEQAQAEQEAVLARHAAERDAGMHAEFDQPAHEDQLPFGPES